MQEYTRIFAVRRENERHPVLVMKVGMDRFFDECSFAPLEHTQHSLRCLPRKDDENLDRVPADLNPTTL
jgi:hypothetical protein